MTTFEKGDRVTRLSFSGEPLYETVILDVDLVEDAVTGERTRLYRLAREDGTPSPIRVEGEEIRAVEVAGG